MGLDLDVTVSRLTESDVRIAEHVQNAVFITFVQWFIRHPKWNGFGQIHAEPGPWCLTCFKFRILRGPQDTVKNANGRHAKNPSWPQSIAHHRGFLIIRPSPRTPQRHPGRHGASRKGPFLRYPIF